MMSAGQDGFYVSASTWGGAGSEEKGTLDFMQTFQVIFCIPFLEIN